VIQALSRAILNFANGLAVDSSHLAQLLLTQLTLRSQTADISL
jgi:hypothetical protein